MNETRYFAVHEADQDVIRRYVEATEPEADYYDDDVMLLTLDEDSEPFYEYPGIILPAYLKLTYDGVDVCSGERIGRISEDCAEFVRDLFLCYECQCQVFFSGGMYAARVGDSIYREFDAYHAILEITAIE